MKQEKELQESHFDKKDKKKEKKKEKKKDKKNKHKEKKQKKYRSRSREKKKKSKKYDSSSSSSYDSSSYDSSYENNLKMQKVREERKLEKQDLQRKRLENAQQVRPIVKLSSLAGLLKDVKKTNINTEEVQRANEKFKQIDHSERTSTLLSGHLTKQFQNERDEYVMEYQNGEYKKIFKPYQCSLKDCNLRFQYSTELSAHMKSHAVQQQKLNQMKANEFAMQLQNNLF